MAVSPLADRVDMASAAGAVRVFTMERIMTFFAKSRNSNSGIVGGFRRGDGGGRREALINIPGSRWLIMMAAVAPWPVPIISRGRPVSVSWLAKLSAEIKVSIKAAVVGVEMRAASVSGQDRWCAPL